MMTVSMSQSFEPFQFDCSHLADNPSQNDDKRNNQQTDLNATSDSDTDTQVEFILNANGDSRDMFRSIANNGQQDQTDLAEQTREKNPLARARKRIPRT